MTEQLSKRLREACKDWPYASIPWPHRLLHDAADELDRRAKELTALEAEVERLREKSGAYLDATWHLEWIDGPRLPSALHESPEFVALKEAVQSAEALAATAQPEKSKRDPSKAWPANFPPMGEPAQPEQHPSGDPQEQDGGWLPMEAEIELCARDLPEGAEVAVMVERGSAWVQASNWDNNHWDDSGYPDHSLAERIALARQWCIETEPAPLTCPDGA